MQFSENKIKKRIKKVLEIEANAIKDTISEIDKEFVKATKILLNCKGRIVVSGMGKPGIIAQKISATLASTGTPSLWLHPAEAVHGDLGKVTREDVVIILSNSGETKEITELLPIIKRIGAKLIAITSKPDSTLARFSDAVLKINIKREACPLGLAPTASTTAMLAVGDAIAVILLELKGFKEEDYAFYHPGGTLGKKLLLKVEDIMRKEENHPKVYLDTTVQEALLKITKARAGSATVIDKKGKLRGIFTDGDLRRWIEKDPHLINRKMRTVMTKNPKVVKVGSLAAEAGRIMQDYKIDELIVADEKNKPVGLLDIQDLLKIGVI
jgi:arabinose-5-phosphate isomerase